MGFFSRLWAIIRGNADAALSKIEDPEKALNIAIKDATAEVDDFRKQVSRALVDQKRLEAEIGTAATSVQEWTRRAEAAVGAGDDALAREALVRRQKEEELARVKYAAFQQQAATVTQLKDALRALTLKLEDAKRRRNLLVARARNAKAKKQMAETLEGAGGGSALQRFDELEAKVEALEVDASATAEMLSQFGSGADSDLESRFKALAAHDPSIDAELANIKANRALGTGTPNKGLLEPGPKPTVREPGESK